VATATKVTATINRLEDSKEDMVAKEARVATAMTTANLEATLEHKEVHNIMMHLREETRTQVKDRAMEADKIRPREAMVVDSNKVVAVASTLPNPVAMEATMLVIVSAKEIRLDLISTAVVVDDKAAVNLVAPVVRTIATAVVAVSKVETTAASKDRATTEVMTQVRTTKSLHKDPRRLHGSCGMHQFILKNVSTCQFLAQT